VSDTSCYENALKNSSGHGGNLLNIQVINFSVKHGLIGKQFVLLTKCWVKRSLFRVVPQHTHLLCHGTHCRANRFHMPRFFCRFCHDIRTHEVPLSISGSDKMPIVFYDVGQGCHDIPFEHPIDTGLSYGTREEQIISRLRASPGQPSTLGLLHTESNLLGELIHTPAGGEAHSPVDAFFQCMIQPAALKVEES
jgi:hypothetical protein